LNELAVYPILRKLGYKPQPMDSSNNSKVLPQVANMNQLKEKRLMSMVIARLLH
jgi:hypothetical protein